MTQLATLFMCLVAVGGLVNAHTLKLPHGVAMMLVGSVRAWLSTFSSSSLPPAVR